MCYTWGREVKVSVGYGQDMQREATSPYRNLGHSVEIDPEIL